MSDAIITALITSIGGFLGIVVALPNWTIIKNRVIRHNVENALSKNPRIASILEDLSQNTQVKKAVLVKIHNSGLRMMAGDAIYGTIIYPTSWRKTFDHQLLDGEYQEKVVYPLLKYKKVWVNIRDLSGHLRAIFSVQNIKCSLCYFIKMMPEKFFFVAVDFEVQEEDITDKTKDDIRRSINEIRILMTK